VIDLPTCPFGGEKNSGIGRFNGEWAIEALTSDQWATMQHTPRHYPWTARDVSGSLIDTADKFADVLVAARPRDRGREMNP
jgi:hypothetical protein